MPTHEDESSTHPRPGIMVNSANYQRMASMLELSGLLQQRQFAVTRYDNGELHAVVDGSISGEHCFVLGSIAPPDQQLISLLLLAHTLKVSGACHITGILPYLAYSRQDKVKAGESLAAAWVGSVVEASGFDRLVTVDLHSQRDRELFPIPLISLSPARLFAAAIHQHGLLDATVVAVDNGAIPRCEAVKEAAGMQSAKTTYFEKKRTDEGVVHGHLVGDVGLRVIFVDDMLDTGGTLISACERLMSLQVKEIYVFVTHGLFTGTQWERLWSLGVKHIFCTDTVQPLVPSIDGKENITVLPVESLLREYLSSEGLGSIKTHD